MSKEKWELIKLLRERRFRDADAINPQPRVGDAPLAASWGQQRLWFIDQLAGGSAGYTVLLAMRLRGVLDRGALEAALAAIVSRHEVLRTVFSGQDGEPRQRILREGRIALKFVDLSHQEGAQRESQVKRHQTEEAHAAFDVRTGPLVRGRLLQVLPEEHVLLVTMHHIIADGWSKGVLVREFAELYRAHVERRASQLAPLTIQYADYAEWQKRRWSHEAAIEKQLDYWRRRLQGVPLQLELPTDRPRPAVQTNSGETTPLVLDASLTAKLRALAHRHDMTLFMVLVAGWVVLLSRLSGQADVSIGTPVANRQRPEVEGLIGLFVNTLVLRVEVHADLSVKDLLEHVRDVTLGAYDHQDVPFEKVVEAVQPQRSLSRSPLFQAMFVLHNWPNTDLRLPGLTATMEDIVDEPAIVDLWVALEERGDEIVGGINYAVDLFDRETLLRWSACFVTLLQGLADGGHQSIGSLPLIPEPERGHLLQSFNDTAALYPRETLIHELIEAQVARTPESVALVCEEHELSYAELNARANQLARYLRQLGVGPNELAAICVERGLDMVVGLLAILKTGAAYVPLDPGFPRERLGHMLDDAAPKVVLTQQRLRDGLPRTAARVIALDSDSDDFSQLPSENLQSPPRAAQPAYVIYTSGSTGVPKGVMVEHRGVVNLLTSMQRTTGIEAHDRLLAVTTPAFDIAALELFLPLVCGACVIVAKREAVLDPAQLSSLITNEKVTMMQATPATWRMLIESGWSGADRLKALCGGEALSSTLAAQLRVRVRELWNVYGPTETTIWSTVYRIKDADSAQRSASQPIGRPIANTQVYVLDALRQIVPIGVTGELYIGGAGVARGYLNRPELTAERFCADPFESEVGSRIYKTGDLGRWRADGTLEYLGRNDQQVKIRGFRIELGEVEAQLQRHPEVKEAVVVARADSSGEQRLVAYVRRSDGGTASLERLRTHLAHTLPDYMLPSAYVVLERLPLTPNGKVDRRSLPAPEPQAYSAAEYDPPRGEVEEALANHWQELLSVERIGREDNFFERGGHSLIAMKVLARIAERFSVRLPAAAVFQRPTIRSMACVVEELRQIGGTPPQAPATSLEQGVI